MSVDETILELDPSFESAALEFGDFTNVNA